MRIANIVQLGIKELWGLLRDPMMLILIVYAFTISIYTASKSQPETLNQAALAIVDEDKSPVATRIITAFNPPYFTIPRLISQAEMDSRMDSGLDTFALNIPPNFQRDMLVQRSPTIQLNVDATRMSQAFTGAGYIQTIVTDEVSEFLARYRSAAALPIGLALRARFNPELNKGWFGAINNVISSVTMLSIILTGAALIREREHGTIEHLLVMPVTPFEIIASKIWSMGLVVLLAASVSLVFIVQG
jgi:ABC-2 type transport system permease protein